LTFSLLVLACIVFAILLSDQRARVRRLDDRIDRLVAEINRKLGDTEPEAPIVATLKQEPAPFPEPVAAPPQRSAAAYRGPARVVAAPVAAVAQQEAPPAEPQPPPSFPEPKPPKPPRSFAAAFEALAGGKLPIWIGGIALVLSGFFLVRYSIEQGLLGPGVRTLLAAILGLVLLAASEAAMRIKRLADDPRVGQALAGAGIASLYGTLYMASELYGLISPSTAFLLMAGVTLVALFLSLRHGPPTAIMGLIGGFAAPFLAEPTGNLVPLLVYLALLIAGLFALAIHRGWLWLALAATGGGVLWSVGIILADLSGIGPALGVFIVIVALAATQILPRIAQVDERLRLLPMLAGFLQLALFAPTIHFGLTGWLLYGLMSVASLYLAWRDPKLAPVNLAALVLVLVLLAAAFERGSDWAPWAAVGATLLFGGAGHALAMQSRQWGALAILGSVGPLLVARFGAGADLLGDTAWGWLFIAAAGACASLSWRADRSTKAEAISSWGLLEGAVMTAAMALIAAGLWFVTLWWAASALWVAAALSGWAKRSGDKKIFFASLGTIGIAAACWLLELPAHSDVPLSVFGDGARPPLEPLIALIAAPAGLLGGLAWLARGTRMDQPLRWATLAFGLAVALALVPLDWHPGMIALALSTALVGPLGKVQPGYAAEGLLVTLGLALLTPLAPFLKIFGQSLTGLYLHYPDLPEISRAAVTLALPAVMAIAGLRQWGSALHPKVREVAYGVAAIAFAAVLYALAKQPLAISDEQRFLELGFAERAVLTQMLMIAGLALLWRGPEGWRRWALLAFGTGLARLVWFDLVIVNPLIVPQQVGALPVLNWATLHFGMAALWLWLAAGRLGVATLQLPARLGALALSLVAVIATIRQAFHGSELRAPGILREEHYAYSAALLLLSILWLWRGIKSEAGWLRVAGLALLTVTTLKVFVIDAAALEGLLRVLSFMGLGVALMGIGWAYSRFVGKPKLAVEAE
jgi:uncharacterized membrane protein